MKTIYRVNFIGRLNRSIGQVNELQKTYVFDSIKTYDEIVQEVYKTHEHVRILKITDLSMAGCCNEVKPL